MFGKVYIRASKPINAKVMELRVKGMEKSSFYYEEGDSDNRRKVKKKYEHVHIDCRVPVFHFEQGPLQPGDYTLPFEFDLPNELPASIMWKRKDDWAKPSIKIKYSVKTIIKTHDEKILKYK